MAIASLRSRDPFNRVWSCSNNERVAHAEAWGSSDGTRLVCAAPFLKKVLLAKDATLLILIRLQRYETDGVSRQGRFSYSTAVVKIDPDLSFTYFEGEVNQ